MFNIANLIKANTRADICIYVLRIINTLVCYVMIKVCVVICLMCMIKVGTLRDSAASHLLNISAY